MSNIVIDSSFFILSNFTVLQFLQEHQYYTSKRETVMLSLPFLIISHILQQSSTTLLFYQFNYKYNNY